MHENELAARVLDCSFRIRRALGPGLLESVYAAALEHELRSEDIPFEREKPVSVAYHGVELGLGFRADFVVGERLIVDLRSVETVSYSHMKQLLTYLRVTNIRLGLLINFNESLLRNGITRIANKL